MFRNVVSARELLSDNFSDRQEFSNDSQQYSQLPYSQPELSQISTQDMFTQQYSSGTQNESSQGKRPTLYEKWKNKVVQPYRQTEEKKLISNNINTLNTTRPQVVPIQSKSNVSFQQQLQMQKVKAKERDERDFLQQVVKTVQECSKEVMLALSSMKDKLDQSTDQTEQSLQQIITAFLDDISQKHDKIYIAIKGNNSSSSRVLELEKELSARAAKIQTLEKIIEDQKQDASDKIVCAVQKELGLPQQKIDDKLSELLESTHQSYEKQSQQMQDHRLQLEGHQKFCVDLKKGHNMHIRDTEKRLVNEVASLRRDLKKKENTFLLDILDQLKSAQEQQMEDLENHITRILDDNINEKTDYSKHNGMQKKEVQELLKKQWEGMQRFIETQFRKQLEFQEQQLSNAVDKIMDTEKRSNECESFLSLPQFEDKMGQYHKDFKKQLENLHERHMQEIKLLRADIGKDSNLNSATHIPPCELNMVSASNNVGQTDGSRHIILPEKQSLDCKFSKPSNIYKAGEKFEFDKRNCHRSAIVSPLTENYRKFNSRSFFSKPSFSPVAAVLPQRKDCQEFESTNNQWTAVNVSATTNSSRDVAAASAKTGKKRKCSNFLKKKKAKHSSKESDVKTHVMQTSRSLRSGKVLTEESVTKSVSTVIPQTSREIRSSSLRNVEASCFQPQTVVRSTAMPAKPLSVYEFVDDKTIEDSHKMRTFVDKRTQGYKYNSQKNEITSFNTSQTVKFPRSAKSPCIEQSTDSDESRDSSPSLSITEVVVKRRIKCDKRTPDINLHFNAGNFQTMTTSGHLPMYDILSTPTLNVISNNDSQPLWTYSKKMQTGESRSVKRSGEKRRLCDISLDSSLMQCLKNQSKQVCHQ